MDRLAWRRPVVAAASLAAALALSGPGYGEEPAPGEPAGGGELLPSQVVLLEPGKKPHAVLRYAPKAGTEWDVGIRVRNDLAVSMPGYPSQSSGSTTSFDLTQRIDSVSADGTAKVTLTVKKARVESGAATTMMKDVTEEQDEMYGLFEGRAVAVTYDAGGNVLGVDAAAFDDLPDDVATLRAFLVSFVQGSSVPLPKEPIGPGARWRLERAIDMFGIRMTAVDTFGPLVRAAGRPPTLTVASAVRSEPQDLTPSLWGLPEGFDAKMTEFGTVGDASGGTVSLRLDGLGFAGKNQAKYRAVMVAGTEEAPLRIPVEMTMETTITFGPAAKKPAPAPVK